MVVPDIIESGIMGVEGNLDICLLVGSLGSISNLANHTYGGERVSGILLVISTVDANLLCGGG